jgi:hypothetical protein
VGRRRPPARQIPTDTGEGVAGCASSDLAGDGVNGWGVQRAAAWWCLAVGAGGEWPPAGTMNG